MYLFGSLETGESREDSDIGIAVRAIEPEQFFDVYGELMSRLKHPVDRVGLGLQKSFGQISLSLAALYNGMERILVTMLTNRNVEIPRDEMWHVMPLGKA